VQLIAARDTRSINRISTKEGEGEGQRETALMPARSGRAGRGEEGDLLFLSPIFSSRASEFLELRRIAQFPRSLLLNVLSVYRLPLSLSLSLSLSFSLFVSLMNLQEEFKRLLHHCRSLDYSRRELQVVAMLKWLK